MEEVKEAQKDRIVAMLLKGSIYGLPGSDGTRWGNFCEWAKNQHPVLSMFMAHELHPFSRSERLSVMMCYLCWAFFITVLFEQSNSDSAAICDPGCLNQYVGRLPDGLEDEDICGSGSGVSVEDFEKACDNVMPWYFLSFIIAAFTVPYSTILKALATCGCVQDNDGCVKTCVECIGALVLRLFGIISIVWLVLGISISLSLDGGMFLITYMTGVVKSWLYWPLIAGAVFTYKYKKQRDSFEQEHPGQVAMAWPISGQGGALQIEVGEDGRPIVYDNTPPDSPTGAAGHPINGQGEAENHQTSPSSQPHYGGNMAPPPQSTYNAYSGGFGAPPTTGYPAPPTDIPTVQGMPGYGGWPVSGGLPPGWESKVEPNGRTVYIDHNTKVTAPTGAMIQVTIPEGSAAGDCMQIPIPP
eukprot:jgi/Undpi1/6788/HiC_scaffold_21.g09265.m1